MNNGWLRYNPATTPPQTFEEANWLCNSQTGETVVVWYLEFTGDIHILNRGGDVLPEDHSFDFRKPIQGAQGPLPLEQVWKNPLPVVVLLVPVPEGILLVRRAARGSFAKLALPGGFQEQGETWQEAGCREVFEETGVRLSPDKVRVFDIETVEGGKVNLIYGLYDGVYADGGFAPQEDEILEVLTTDCVVDLAFPSHQKILTRYFAQEV